MPIEKNVLLELVKGIAETESKTGHRSDASRKLLETYATKYELVVVDSTFKPADSAMVQVRMVQDKVFPHIDLKLPLRLQHLLTYADLEEAFGKGIEAPRPKEPIGFSVMYHFPLNGQITIAAHSERPPEVIHPNIYELMIL